MQPRDSHINPAAYVFLWGPFLDRIIGQADKGKRTNRANLDFLRTFCLLSHANWTKKPTLHKELPGHVLGGLTPVSGRPHGVKVTEGFQGFGPGVPWGTYSCSNAVCASVWWSP